VGGLGGTYGGNPLACAAALATIEQIQKLKLVERAQQIGGNLRERLAHWQTQNQQVGEVRGLGAMMAVEFVEDRKTKTPAKEYTLSLIKRILDHGVIVIYAGTYNNVLRFLVPLVITDEQLEEGLAVIEGLLES
jgi:4-aminobutyrate aminotransferase/(S)-3-amino-2-methylpropionate transaminase